MIRCALPVRAALVALAVVCLPATGTAQDIPVVRLARPSATFAEPLSSIRGLRELSAGRVVVTDMIETAIRILDFRSGTSHEVGRQGSGPGEYGMPGELFAAAGDTTLMMDMGNRRLKVITPQGRMLDDGISVREAGGPIPVFPRGSDARGNMYYDLSGIVAPGMQDIATKGQAPLIRWNLATKRADTVTMVNFPAMSPQQAAAGPGRVRVTMGGTTPYQPRDAWAVSADGRVAVVRYNPYRVEWYTPGGSQAVSGPPVEYRPVRIGKAEKEAWADRMTQGIMVMMQEGRRRTMQPPRPNIDEQEWPEFMPPFTGSARITGEGEVWIERSRPASAKRELYDVFDSQGRLVRQIEMAEGRRLIGFGKGVLYAVRTDEDDLQWLERYAR
jgi:hypothetical protein